VKAARRFIRVLGSAMKYIATWIRCLIGLSALIALLAMASSTLGSALALSSRGVVRSFRNLYSSRIFTSIASSSPVSNSLSHYLSSQTRLYSQTKPKMSANAFIETLAGRRTIYALKKESPISDARIQEIVTEVIKHVPSSFNSQTTRVVLLVKEEHDKLWELHKEVLKPIVPEADWTKTEGKIDMFKGAYATVCSISLLYLPIILLSLHCFRSQIFRSADKKLTSREVLFFIDTPTVQGFQTNFALYADRFPQWATESSGAHQIAAWAALEAEGLGANVQHYNPLIDEKVKATWNVPEGWELQAELVVGTPVAPAGEKTYKDIAGERLKVYGA